MAPTLVFLSLHDRCLTRTGLGVIRAPSDRQGRSRVLMPLYLGTSSSTSPIASVSARGRISRTHSITRAPIRLVIGGARACRSEVDIDARTRSARRQFGDHSQEQVATTPPCRRAGVIYYSGHGAVADAGTELTGQFQIEIGRHKRSHVGGGRRPEAQFLREEQQCIEGRFSRARRLCC